RRPGRRGRGSCRPRRGSSTPSGRGGGRRAPRASGKVSLRTPSDGAVSGLLAARKSIRRQSNLEVQPMRSHPRLGFSALILAVAAALAVGAGASTHAFPGKNGRIVFNDRTGSLVLVNADGTGLVRLARTYTTDTYIGAAWSPDGKQIAYSGFRSNDPDIFTISPDGSNQREVTFSRGIDTDPTWSPDGTRIAFETNRNGNVDIYSVNADGGGSPTQLTSGQLDDRDPSWSRTNRIAYTVMSADQGSSEIWVMNGDGSGKKQ